MFLEYLNHEHWDLVSRIVVGGKGVRVAGFFSLFVGLALVGKDIVFRFIIEY